MAEEKSVTVPPKEEPKKPRNYSEDPIRGPFQIGYLGAAPDIPQQDGVSRRIRERTERQKKADRQLQEARSFLEKPPKDQFYPSLRDTVPPAAAPLDTPRAPRAPLRREEAPPIYGSSPTAPEGWQPSPQEIKRLVKEEKMLSAREAGDPNKVWKAGRASISRKKGLAGFDKQAGQAMVQDVLRGESMIQKAMWQQVPANMRQVRGDTPVDTAGMFADTNQIHRGLLFRKYREEGKDLSPGSADLEKLEEEAHKNTLRSMASFMQTGSGLLWIDAFDRDITQEIMDSNKVMQIWKVLTSPTRYGSVGGGGIPRTHAEGVARSQMSFSPGQLKSESILSKFGRFAPSTLFSPIVFGGHDYMSREYIDAIRAGDDITFHIGDLARGIEGVDPGEETGRLAKVASAVAVGGVILFEPDLMSLLFLPVGAVGKAGKVAKMSTKARRASTKIRRLEKTLATGGKDLTGIGKELERFDEAVMRAVELRAVAELGLSQNTRVTGAGGGRAAENLFQRTSAFLGKADRLRKEAEELRTAAVSQEALELAARKDMGAAEYEYLAAYVWRESAEAQKIEFLKMHGLSEEEAAKIMFEKDVPISSAGAKKNDEIARRARKKAKAIRQDPGNQEALKQYDKAARALGAQFQTLTKGFLALSPEALTKAGKPRVGWDVLAVQGNKQATQISSKSESFAVPTYGQKIRVPTKRGGSRVGEVASVRIRGPKGTRLSKGNDNQIVIKLEDGEEFIHPFRINEGSARTLRKHITEFEEKHRLVANEGGILDQLVALRKAEVDAEEYAAMLRTSGPTGRKVAEFQEAGEALSRASTRYSEAAKKAGLQERGLEQIRKSFGKKGVGLTKAEIKAFEVGQIRKVYGKAMRDVADGLDNFVDIGLRNLGVVGFKSLGKARKSLKALGKLDLDDIKNFGQKISETRVEEIYRGMAKNSWKFKAANKTRKKAVVEFDVDSLIQDLITQVGGAERVEEFISSPGGKNLHELISWAEEAIKLGKKPKVGIRGEKAGLIQEEIQNAIRVGEADRLFTEDVAWGRAIHEAWQDLGLGSKEGGYLRRMASRARRVAPRVKGSFDNIRQRAGEYSKEVGDALVATERLVARGQLELLEVGRLEEFGTTPAERFSNWLDYQGEVKLKEGTAQWGVLTGNGTPYQKGALQLSADSRIDPRLAAKNARQQEEAIKQLGRQLVTKLRKAIGSKLDDEVISEEFIEHAIQAARDITPDLVPTTVKGGTGISGAPRALVSVSHMWLPRGMAADVSPDDSALLMGLAKMFLRSSNTYKPALNGLGEVIDVGFAAKMRRATFAIIGDVDSNPSRANAFAAAGFTAATTLGTFGRKIERAAGSAISAEAAADVNRILMGEWDQIKDLDGAMGALNRMGMPFTQKEVKSGMAEARLTGVATHMRSFVELGTKEGGSSMVPKNLVDLIEDKIGKIAKDPTASKVLGRDLPGQMYNDALNGYLRLWRGSAVTGLALPNPRYWTNNMFGDFSQLWAEAGLGTAARMSFTNAPTNLPFYGRKLQEMNLYMAERVAGKSGKGQALPGMLTSFLNPHLGRLFKGEAGQFVTKNGDIVSFDQARRWGLEDGIAESFVREELMSLHHRVADDMLGMGKEMAGWWQGQIYNHASLVQERMRMAFYLDQIQKGVPRKLAAKNTKRALYDWSHGIAEWEARTISRIVPFWRFWRLSLKQTEYSFMEPFVRPSAEYAKKALAGNTKLARLRQQLLIWPSLPDFVYQDNPHAGMTTNEKVDTLAKQLYPSWADTRPKVGVVPFDPARRENYQRSTGRDMTHEMIILPQVTATDSMDMLAALWTGVGLTLNKFSGAIGLPTMEFDKPGDVAARFWEPILGGTAPGFEAVARATLSTWNVDLDYQIKGSDRYLSPEEEKAWKLLPGLRGQLTFDPEKGRYKAPQKIHALYRILPIAPTQVQGWVGAFTSPEWDQGMKEGFIAATQRLTGIGRHIPFNVNREVDGRLRDVRKEFTDFMKDNSGVLKPYGGPRTEGIPEERKRELERRSRGFSKEEE